MNIKLIQKSKLILNYKQLNKHINSSLQEKLNHVSRFTTKPPRVFQKSHLYLRPLQLWCSITSNYIHIRPINLKIKIWNFKQMISLFSISYARKMKCLPSYSTMHIEQKIKIVRQNLISTWVNTNVHSLI